MRKIISRDDFRWFNNNTMAVHRADHFVYTLYQQQEEKRWYVVINLCTEFGLLHNFAKGSGENFEQALENARDIAFSFFCQLNAEL